MIRCEALVFEYPDGMRAIDGIDLAIGPGERVAIVGRNGAGKTTLVRHWNGLLRPTSGRVLVDGRPTDGWHVAELARTVGLTFQDPTAQLFERTCRAEVAFGARNVGLRGSALERAIDTSLATVGLADRADANPYDLGPSRRRLLALAGVLAMGTAIVVLDEPTMGLDTQEIGRVEAIVAALAKGGRTVVVISHDMRFVARAFDRVIQLADGRVVADGPSR